MINNELNRKRLKDILISDVNSPYKLEAIICMYFNNEPFSTKEIWKRINKDFLKVKIGKTPSATFSSLIRKSSDSLKVSKLHKITYFHIVDAEVKPQKFVLIKEFRKHIDSLLEEIKKTEEVVYGISPEKSTDIKIGRTNDTESRLKQGQTWHSEKLKYIFQTTGGKDFEKWLHDKIFGDFRKEGEWFDLNWNNLLTAVIPILKKVYELEKVINK